MADTLTATNLTISRGGRLLVDGLDLSLKEGTVTALTGPNGSGKTTTAWCLGLHDLDFTGTVTIDGRPSGEMSPRDIRLTHRTTIALQPQDLLLEDSWTPVTTLRHAAWALGLPRRQRAARIADALSTVRLTPPVPNPHGPAQRRRANAGGPGTHTAHGAPPPGHPRRAHRRCG